MSALIATYTMALALGASASGDTLVLDGVFVEDQPWVFTYEPEVDLGPIEVLESAKEGAVDRGDRLLRLCPKKLEERLASSELEWTLARLKVARLEALAVQAYETAQIDLEGKALALADRERALNSRLTIGAPQTLRSSEDRVRYWDSNFQDLYVQFQIRVRTYEADGVLEETERMDIESRRRGLDQMRERRPHVMARHEILKDQTEPRRTAELEHSVRNARYDYELAKATAPLNVKKAHHDLAQAKLSLKRREDELAKLKRDRDRLLVEAPRDGVLIVGRYDGKWSELNEAARRHQVGGRIAKGQVVFSVVQPAPKWVEVSIPEASLGSIQVGQEVVLLPTAVSNLSLPGTIEEIALCGEGGFYKGRVRVHLRHEKLVAGYTCKVEIRTGS